MVSDSSFLPNVEPGSCARAPVRAHMITPSFRAHVQLIYSSPWVYLYSLDNCDLNPDVVCLWNVVRPGIGVPILLKQDKC